MRKPLVILLVALAAAPAARAANVAMVARDVPLGPRAVQAAAAPMHFNMLGVHWAGAGGVQYRTHRLHGDWRAWRDVDDDGRPDTGSHERDRAWRDGNLDWTGASDGVQFRTRGAVHRLRAYYLWSRVTTAPRRRLSVAGAPAIVTRSLWAADEKIRRAKPKYAPALKVAVVHHTAGTNAYSPAQAAAIVRGIEIYHVKGNGWDDIGYNFLVDRYGNIYEGRWGGVEQNVVGAHSQGFNRGTAGVSLIGNFSSATPPKAQQDALVNLLAWRLDVAHLDPLSSAVVTSTGNPRYHAGTAVTLRSISGHRDTGPTTCPGSRAYALLPGLAQRVAATGAPKLYSPVVSGKLGGSVRFQARLSEALPWTVTISNSKAAAVARGSGTGTVVDWTWNSARAGKEPFAWTIAAGPDVRPASGAFGTIKPPPPAPVAPTLSKLAVTPAVVGPLPDATGTARVSFTLGSAARVTASVRGFEGGDVVTVLNENRRAGANSFDLIAAGLPDGRYTLLVTATAAGKTAAQQIAVVVDRTLYGLALTVPVVSPNGDGTLDTLPISFSLTRPVPVRVEIRRAGALGAGALGAGALGAGAVVATVFVGPIAVGPQRFEWNGLTALGTRLADGVYEVAVTVTDALGDVTYVAPFTVDTVAPVLTLLDLATLRFQVSEAATVTLMVNGQPREVAVASGVFAVPWFGPGPVSSVSAQARDAAGNTGPAVTTP